MQTKKKQINVYKYTTIILLLVILSFGVLVILNNLISSEIQDAYNLGQEDAIEIVIQNIIQNGQVNIITPENNLTLIPIEELSNFQDLLIESIISEIQMNGEVNLISPEGDEFTITFS